MILQLIYLIFIPILIYYLINWRTKDSISQKIDLLPGPIRLPLIGTTLWMLLVPEEDRLIIASNKIRQYGPIVRSWFGTTPLVHLTIPEHIELVLNNSVQISKNFIYDTVRPWLGDGLLTSTGKKWFTHRKILTPTFHFKILENFMEVFVEKSESLVKHIKSKSNGETFDLYPYITRCTLDIICETAMGVQINAISNPDNEYVRNVYNISRLVIDRMLKPWLYPDFIYYKTNAGKEHLKSLEVLHGFTGKVIKDRKKILSENEFDKLDDQETLGRKSRKAFLDLLLELETGFTDIELREEVDTFMFEGHDTTTAGICWSLFLLGNHLKIQDEVYKEIKSVFDESNGNLTINDLNKLKLLERCIKEALRLYPSVPVIGRQMTEDVQIGNYTIPAGSNLNIEIFVLHHDENIYPNPGKFDPDRFLPENIKSRHPYAYIPFSAGSRNCIGQKFAMNEEKTILAYILKNYKVTSVETEETVKPMMELILRPKNGLLVNLDPRGN